MTGTQVVNVQEEMNKELADFKKRLQGPSGDFIKCTKKKTFKLPNGEEQAGPIHVVILDFVSSNFFYDRPWREGDIVPPACFALGTDKNDDLVPHDSSPAKEAEKCKDCPNNLFGSKGTGKACANNIVLAVLINPESTADDQQIYLLKLSPTAIKPFTKYVDSVRSDFGTTPIGVVTELYFDPTVDHQSIRFGRAVKNPNLQAHWGRKGAAKARLLTPPDVSAYTPVVKKVKK